MITGLDLGGSFVKRIDLTNGMEIIEKSLIPTIDFTQFIKKTDISTIDRFILTGGKCHQVIGSQIKQKITKIHEFESMRYFLKGQRITEGILASLGTGVPILEIDNKGYRHITGTGQGGGTIVGLGSRILKISDFTKLEELASQGDPSQVNILVGEIVGDGIGLASANETASNFGKITKNERDEDISAAIFQMVCESIAMLAGFVAVSMEKGQIHFIGTLSKSPLVKKMLTNALLRYSVKPVFYDNPEYAAILGAIDKFIE